MKIVSNYFVQNKSFVGALGACVVGLLCLVPYHQSVSRVLEKEDSENYSLELDVTSHQLENLLKRGIVCVYGAKDAHIYNVFYPRASLGVECVNIVGLSSVAKVAKGVRIKVLAHAGEAIKKIRTNVKAHVVLGEVPLAYEVWRRLAGYEVSAHQAFETPAPADVGLPTQAKRLLAPRNQQ